MPTHKCQQWYKYKILSSVVLLPIHSVGNEKTEMTFVQQVLSFLFNYNHQGSTFGITGSIKE